MNRESGSLTPPIQGHVASWNQEKQKVEVKQRMFGYVPGLFEEENSWFNGEQDRIYKDAQKAFPLARLDGIRALGFLSQRVGDDPRRFSFIHSRYFHTMSVARTQELILRNNEFSEADINHGIIAALLHDIATPAGGDAVKELDREVLDEEEHWREMLNDDGRSFIRDHGLTEEQLDDTVHNRGGIGKILDVADRLTYTYMDSAFIDMDERHIHNSAPLIYRTVRYSHSSGEIYFEDADRLGIFLHERAKNHNDVYLQPENKGRELLLQNLTAPYYSRDGSKPFSPDVLRSMTDEDFLETLGSNIYRDTGNIHSIYDFIDRGGPKHTSDILSFKSHEEASDAAARLKDNDRLAPLGPWTKPGIDPCTHYLVADGTGFLHPYSQWDKRSAAQIEELAGRGKTYLFRHSVDLLK
jgi:hypothetical protein